MISGKASKTHACGFLRRVLEKMLIDTVCFQGSLPLSGLHSAFQAGMQESFHTSEPSFLQSKNSVSQEGNRGNEKHPQVDGKLCIFLDNALKSQRWLDSIFYAQGEMKPFVKCSFKQGQIKRPQRTSR